MKGAPPRPGRPGRLSPSFPPGRGEWEEGLEEAERPAVRDGAGRAGIRRRKRRRLFEAADSWRWGAGALALAMLLGLQTLEFEGGHLARNVHARPWLEGICANLGCVLPPFRDIGRLQIMDRALNRAGGNKEGFEFSLTFTNRSALPQAFPGLKLVLNELGGPPVAERLFEPYEYFTEWQSGMLMPVGQSFEVHLSLAKPSREVGGFAIEFQ